MRLAKTFLKSIPKEKIDLVLQKIRHFEQLLFEYEAQIRALPAGFWVRKVSGTEIFKFRLNQKDRVLFKFAENRADCSQSEILFLRYVCHDEQIRRAKALALALAGETEWVDAESVLESITSEISMQSATDTVTMPELEIDLKYSEDTIESSVDAEVCAEFQSYGDRLDEIESIVVDDDFASLSARDKVTVNGNEYTVGSDDLKKLFAASTLTELRYSLIFCL